MNSFLWPGHALYWFWWAWCFTAFPPKASLLRLGSSQLPQNFLAQMKLSHYSGSERLLSALLGTLLAPSCHLMAQCWGVHLIPWSGDRDRRQVLTTWHNSLWFPWWALSKDLLIHCIFEGMGIGTGVWGCSSSFSFLLSKSNVFQFYGDTMDMQHCISLRYTAWADLHILQNDYHLSLVNIHHLIYQSLI